MATRVLNDMKREYTETRTEPNPSHHQHSYSSPLHFPFQSDPNSPKDPNPDEASIEIQRRPRGRPPGSKNKPKPPIIITRQPDPTLSPYILEIPDNVDIIGALKTHSRRRNTSLSVLSATGAISNLTLQQTRNSNSSSSAAVTCYGRFDILSLTATFISPSTQSQIPNFEPNVAVSVSVPQGQIIGGIVAGELVASGTVYVVAASFVNTVFLRLPGEDDESSGGNEGRHESQSGEKGNSNAAVLSSDVIWAPAVEQRSY